jgi:acetyl esterase
MPIDEGAQRVLDMVRESGRPPYETLSVAEAREVSRQGRAVTQPDPPDVAELRDLEAPGPRGAIRMRLYRGLGTTAGSALAGLVYFHGGGWTIGDLDSHDVICRQIANAAGCAVVSVDYALAPEHKFPAGVDDAVAATAWVAQHAADLGVDAARLAVGGDSGGGNLAAVVALDARNRGGPRLGLQVLVYPATDMSLRHDSHRRYGEGLFLTHSLIVWFREHYLRTPADREDWRASPALARDFRNLPPAVVITAGFDPLVDEGEEYAQKLIAAGVPVTVRRFPGQIHAFFTMGADDRRFLRRCGRGGVGNPEPIGRDVIGRRKRRAEKRRGWARISVVGLFTWHS